jgi:hypothetical protein
VDPRSERASLFAAFLTAGVEYVVVGGVAVQAHGFLRHTSDLDIFMRPTLENAKAAFAALESLGADEVTSIEGYAAVVDHFGR